MKQYLIDITNRDLVFLGDLETNPSTETDAAIDAFLTEHDREPGNASIVLLDHAQAEALHQKVINDTDPLTYYAIDDHAVIDRLTPESGKFHNLEEAIGFAEQDGDYTVYGAEGVFNTNELKAWFEDWNKNL